MAHLWFCFSHIAFLTLSLKVRTSQLIPLAAIYAYDNENSKLMNLGTNQNLLAQWYWCGVMGELYGGANEVIFSLAIVWILLLI